MNESVSPAFRKLLAMTLLVVVTWIFLAITVRLVATRVGVFQQTQSLKQAYGDIISRRVDHTLLERRLAALLASPSVKDAVVVAENDKAALALTQQVVRKLITAVSAQLLSLNPILPTKDARVVGFQIRMRMPESSLTTWLSSSERGQPRIHINDLSVRLVSQAPTSTAEIEVTATLTAPWIQHDGSSS